MKLLFTLIVFLLVSTFGYNQKLWTFVTEDINGKDKTGIINDSGSILVPIKYDRVFKDGEVFFLQNNKLWGCCKKGGQILIPLQYDDIGLKVGENLVRVKKAGKWGFVDLKNNLLIDYKFDFACNFIKGTAFTILGQTIGFIDKKGNLVSLSKKVQDYCPEDLATDVELKNQFQDSILIIVKENGKFGVKEKKSSKVIIPAVYDEIGDYYFGTILVKKNNKWGACFDSGKLITEPKYKSIGVFWKE